MVSSIKLKYEVNSKNFLEAGNVSQDIKNKLIELKINPEVVRKTALAIYEGELNMIIHTFGGTIEVEITEHSIIVELNDTGPGISDVSLAMQQGFSTISNNNELKAQGRGEGIGFTNMMKFSDTFDIKSKVGKGTTIKMSINR
jgi:serine/threonine-protein kinase RsbT